MLRVLSLCLFFEPWGRPGPGRVVFAALAGCRRPAGHRGIRRGPGRGHGLGLAGALGALAGQAGRVPAAAPKTSGPRHQYSSCRNPASRAAAGSDCASAPGHESVAFTAVSLSCCGCAVTPSMRETAAHVQQPKQTTGLYDYARIQTEFRRLDGRYTSDIMYAKWPRAFLPPYL
jgi:hypothetical protein